MAVSFVKVMKYLPIRESTHAKCTELSLKRKEGISSALKSMESWGGHNLKTCTDVSLSTLYS